MAGLVLRLMGWIRTGLLRPYQPERHYMRGGRQKA
jgi:hypothetical protein